MAEALADNVVDAASKGRKAVFVAAGQEPIPFADGVELALRARSFVASKETLARLTGNALKVLEEASRLGLGIKDAAVLLRSEFANMREFELRRIARTEINRAQQDAAFLTEKELGIEFHEWITAADERVRSSHRGVHGQIVKVGDPFGNGLIRPMAPGAPLSEIVNCRCRIAPVIAGLTATGRTDPRRMSQAQIDEIVEEWMAAGSLAGLTMNEIDAVDYYTSEGFLFVNTRLRGEFPVPTGPITPFEQKIQDTIFDLEQMVNRNPTTAPMIVNRRVGYSAFGLEGDPRDLTAFQLEEFMFAQKGRVISDAAFMSTSALSTAPGSLGAPEVLLRMNLPAGTAAANISSISAFTEEAEVLLGRNLKMIVTDIKEIDPAGRPSGASGLFEVFVDVLP